MQGKQPDTKTTKVGDYLLCVDDSHQGWDPARLLTKGRVYEVVRIKFNAVYVRMNDLSIQAPALSRFVTTELKVRRVQYR